MKKILFILIALPMIGFGQACQYGSSIDASEICDYFRGNSFASDRNADLALEMILDATGSTQRFAIKECSNISNCVATTYKGINYILYDKAFMDYIARNTNSWSKISILAHEIGHHVNGHTLSAPPSLTAERQWELEADEYSGFVMYKLGASLKDAQIAIHHYGKDGDDTYNAHPSKDKRLRAIAKGYNKSKNDYITKTLTASDYFYKAYNYSQKSEYWLAIDNYTKSIRLDPEASAYINRGVDYTKLGNYEDAIADYTRAIRIDADDEYVYYNRGLSHGALGNHEDAIADFTRVIRINNDYTNVYYNRGLAHQHLHKYEESIADFTKAIRIDHDNYKLYGMRGYAKKKLKLPYCSDYKKACDLGDENCCEWYYKQCR